jgi:hypothetical protein
MIFGTRRFAVRRTSLAPSPSFDFDATPSIRRSSIDADAFLAIERRQMTQDEAYTGALSALMGFSAGLAVAGIAESMLLPDARKYGTVALLAVWLSADILNDIMAARAFNVPVQARDMLDDGQGMLAQRFASGAWALWLDGNLSKPPILMTDRGFRHVFRSLSRRDESIAVVKPEGGRIVYARYRSGVLHSDHGPAEVVIGKDGRSLVKAAFARDGRIHEVVTDPVRPSGMFPCPEPPSAPSP